MGEKTIVALSTPPGESAIAVVRISGEDSAGILESMAPGSSSWKPHALNRALLKDRRGEPIDEVLAVLMKGPDSYTGEDVVEISCHGSPHLVTAIIEEAIHNGAEVAEPGEFTKRAFLNGKIDLAQAEAVADLISSETRLQSRVALEHLMGGLSERIGGLEGKLLEMLSIVEVSIDFSEEDIEAFSPDGLIRASGELRRGIISLIESHIPGRKLRQGIKVTLTGPRNAGKSSIYNTLLGEERAIVSHIPGTTRDILRERIHIKGFTYFLEDTAGIAETGCELEAMGISVGREAVEAADLVIFVLDGSGELKDPDLDLARMIRERKRLVVVNKKDLGLKNDRDKVARLLDTESVIEVSAITGEGLDSLKEWIYDSTVSSGITRVAKERIAINARQRGALEKALASLERMEREVSQGQPPEIIAVELRAAAAACAEITGRSVEADILDNIFSNFCIGK